MAESSLQDFVKEVNGTGHLRVEHDYGDGFVRLHTSEAERRQAAQDIQCSENIVLELLRNARDAHSSNVFLATGKEGKNRIITAIDDGDGIPDSMHEHVFEPRVTSKLDTSRMDSWGLHGRGMALYSIAENATSACVVCSAPNLGASIKVTTDTERLGEKADQSSFPSFTLDGEGTVNVRGPRNIVRTACEFAIAERDHCSVYVGTASEIAAALYAHGLKTLSTIDRIFSVDVQSMPLAKRIATASDPDDFAAKAAELGLEISSRTARRILDGEIEAPSPLLDQIIIEKGCATGRKRTSRARSSQRVKINQQDKGELADGVKRAYAAIADRYYLSSAVDVKVTMTQQSIMVTIPIVEK